MITFSLDPPSGHEQSYWDVKFFLEFDNAEKATVNLFNLTTKEHLHILGISSGYISEETTAIAKNTNKLDGYFNIFNQDKMNLKFAQFGSVEIECVIKFERHGEITEEKEIVYFYNESKSIDGTIVPFDLVIENNIIDITRNIPMSLHLVCDDEKRFELTIKASDSRQSSPFEVFLRKGRTDIIIPSEVLFHDLRLFENNNHLKRYDIYYTKFQGLDYSGFLNRKHILIPNSQIKFNSNSMMPQPQGRLGPLGTNLSADFTLSDRYFVHAPNEYTGFAALVKAPVARISNHTRFMHEVQHMQKVDHKKSVAAKKIDKSKNIKRTIAQDAITARYYHNLRNQSQQREFLQTVSHSYSSKRINRSHRYKNLYEAQISAQSPNSTVGNNPKKGGCGCARNKNK